MMDETLNTIRERQGYLQAGNLEMAERIESTLRSKGIKIRDYRNGQGRLVTIWQEEGHEGEVEAET